MNQSRDKDGCFRAETHEWQDNHALVPDESKNSPYSCVFSSRWNDFVAVLVLACLCVSSIMTIIASAGRAKLKLISSLSTVPVFSLGRTFGLDRKGLPKPTV